MLDKIEMDSKKIIEELIEKANLKEGKILVIGCSSSEVIGEKIGKSSNKEVAEKIYKTIIPILEKNKIHLSVQCCEHLNRALVVEREVAEKNRI